MLLLLWLLVWWSWFTAAAVTAGNIALRICQLPLRNSQKTSCLRPLICLCAGVTVSPPPQAPLLPHAPVRPAPRVGPPPAPHQRSSRPTVGDLDDEDGRCPSFCGFFLRARSILDPPFCNFDPQNRKFKYQYTIFFPFHSSPFF